MANANAPTARMLDDAGIAQGMRILDVGCAMGLLTRDLAVRAGPSGAVVGIDLEADRLEQARAEQAPDGSAPIDYIQADLSKPLPDLGTFDAIIGRRLLMYMPDPVHALRQLVPLLRPGGVMAWHEHSGVDMPWSVQPLKQHGLFANMVWDTIVKEGGRRSTALELPRILAECGLEVDPMRAEAIVMAQDAQGGAKNMAQMMLPRMIAAGVVDSAFDSDGFVAALEAERKEAGGPIIWDIAYMTIARKPA